MYKIPFTISIVLFSFTLSFAIELNNSFEVSKNGIPEKWHFSSTGSGSYEIDTQISHTGLQSLKLQNSPSANETITTSGVWTNINVQPKALYRISFHYRVLSAEIGARVNIKLHSINKYGELKRIGFVSRWLGSDKEWKKYEAGDFYIEPDIKKIRIDLILKSKGQNATVLFDDISITNIETTVMPGKNTNLLALKKNYSLWLASGSKKVFQEDLPPPDTTSLNEIKIKAAKNETEPFQLAIRPNINLTNLTWIWSDFSGPVNIPKENLVCHKVEYIDIQEKSGPHGKLGLNPDPLPILPMTNSFELHANKTQPFWFLVTIPASVPHGNYRGNLTILHENKEWLNVYIDLTVWNFTLPASPTLDIRSQISPSHILNYETGSKLNVLKRYYSSIIAHRSRPKRLYPSLPIQVQNEKIQVNTIDLEKHLKYISEIGQCTSFEILGLLFIRHKNDHKWPVDASWKGIKIFTNDTNTVLTSAFERHFSEATRQILNALKKVNCYGSPSIKFFDEPDLAHTPTINAFKAISTLLKSIDKNIRIVTAARFPHHDLSDFVDEWDVYAEYIPIAQTEIQTAIENGNKVNVYHNTIPTIDLPILRTRLFPWMLWQSEIKGALCWWDITYWKENPWTATKNVTGSVLYPPRVAGEKGPITSLRWEMLRQGLEDYEYLNILKKLSTNENTPVFDSIFSELDSIVSRFPNVFPINDQPYILDTKKLDILRTKIAMAIASDNLSRSVDDFDIPYIQTINLIEN